MPTQLIAVQTGQKQQFQAGGVSVPQFQQVYKQVSSPIITNNLLVQWKSQFLTHIFFLGLNAWSSNCLRVSIDSR